MRPALALVAAVALMGCEAGLGAGGPTPEAGAGPAAASGAVDVTAPDVFQANEKGLWDGRPSLGGIWVAHPDAQDPERVRIVNRANGQQVIGALFRRERDLPGPALQVSSDAAEALGMLAGAPVDLEVVALRRQEPPAETPAAEGQEESPTTAAAPPAETPAAQSDAADGAGAAAPIAGPSAVAPGPSAGAIATTSLDEAAGTPAPAAQGAPLSALRSPFVQLATFDSQSNAVEAAQTLAGQGLPARVVPSSGGRAWRLLLGPASTEAEQQALLARAMAAGFEDAYLVRS